MEQAFKDDCKGWGSDVGFGLLELWDASVRFGRRALALPWLLADSHNPDTFKHRNNTIYFRNHPCVCMYSCMCIYIYTYIYTYVHTCSYTYVHVCTSFICT